MSRDIFKRAFRYYLLACFSVWLMDIGAKAQDTNGLSQAEIQGQQLAQEILEQSPTTNFTQTGVLRIRSAAGTKEMPVTFATAPLVGSYWLTEYHLYETNKPGAIILLTIMHQTGFPNQYQESEFPMNAPHIGIASTNILTKSQIMVPFAGSDFWIADLGLEFFHWPEQKIIKHETRRTRACTVLESTNPEPSLGSYSRVDSWVDDETLGIVHAEAYDANGKLLKEFDPKSFKKVNGQWELQDMEIRNIQTGSRTWIKFNLNGGS
jgi:hypothetical protein